jgi:hypothetical protein
VIDGVAPASGLSVTDGCAVGREAEQPASTKLTATTATECFRSLAIFMPRDSAVGYTA